MSSITPITPVNTTATIQPVASAIANGNVGEKIAITAILKDGTLVRGFVVNRDSENNPIIRTESGDFVIKSDVFVKTGSDVVLRVNSHTPSQANILSIDHMTPEEYSAQNTRTQQTDTISDSEFNALAQAIKTPETAEEAASYPVLRAVVLQAFARAGIQAEAQAAPPLNAPPPQAPAIPGGISPLPQTGQSATAIATPPLPQAAPPPSLSTFNTNLQVTPGTNLNITIYDVKLPPMPVSIKQMEEPSQLNLLLPGANQGTAPVTLTPTAANAASPTTPAAILASAFSAYAPKTSAAAPAALHLSPPATLPLPAGTLPSTTPGQPAGQPTAPLLHAPANAPNILLGTVIGQGEDGASIIHTQIASLKLYAAQPLPTNTTILLGVEPAATPTIMPEQLAFAGLGPLPPNTLPPITFSALSTAIATLMSQDPAIARELMANLPTLGPRFTAGLLHFLSTVKSGDKRGLFAALDRARLDAAAPGLLGSLGQDIAELNAQWHRPPMDEWRPVQLPLMFGTSLEKAELYIRKDTPESDSAAEKSAAGQRFVLDLHLSQLGDMQLDGFVRNGERGKSLELFLRSAGTLEPEISDEIRTLFTNATEAAGLSGNLIFQQGSEHFVKPAAPGPANTTHPPHTILA